MNFTQLKEKLDPTPLIEKLFSKKISKKDMKGNLLLNISLMIRHFIVTHKNLAIMSMTGLFAFIIFLAIFFRSYEKKVGEANKWFEISLSFYRKAFIDQDLTPDQRVQSLRQSIGRFQDVVNRFGGTPLKYDSLMYMGNAYFEIGDYNNAIKKYQELIDKKSGYYFADFVLINIAKCYEQMNNIQGALTAYQSVIDDYSKATAVAEAKFSIAKLKELTNQADEAFQMYQNVIRDHPQSVWAQESRRRILFLQAIAKKAPAPKPTQPTSPVKPSMPQTGNQPGNMPQGEIKLEPGK
ncbi:MAG: tetratricopeptide repeat protein [Spirochaetes bacterium]|nr:tetratricopeptide repeat protein [Spirochaetota bacterium]